MGSTVRMRRDVDFSEPAGGLEGQVPRRSPLSQGVSFSWLIAHTGRPSCSALLRVFCAEALGRCCGYSAGWREASVRLSPLVTCESFPIAVPGLATFFPAPESPSSKASVQNLPLTQGICHSFPLRLWVESQWSRWSLMNLLINRIS